MIHNPKCRKYYTRGYGEAKGLFTSMSHDISYTTEKFIVH